MMAKTVQMQWTNEQVEAIRKQRDELLSLVQAMLVNDPNDMVADGVTVLDAWRKKARKILG